MKQQLEEIKAAFNAIEQLAFQIHAPNPHTPEIVGYAMRGREMVLKLLAQQHHSIDKQGVPLTPAAINSPTFGQPGNVIQASGHARLAIQKKAAAHDPQLPSDFCCRHLSGPDPDPAELIRFAQDTTWRLDEYAFPLERRAFECRCTAAAKHRMMLLGASLFLCNPCLRAFATHYETI